MPKSEHIRAFQDLLPKALELHLEFNQHKACYETAEEYYALRTCEDEDWVSPEEREKAFKEDTVWILHWYPNTPVGFNVRRASSLEALFQEPF